MLKTTNLGFPRIGANRELKKAVEGYWKENLSLDELNKVAKEIRSNNWKLQKEANIDYIPSNDFSFYDQILDTIALFGAVPERFLKHFTIEDKIEQDLYFAMARGAQGEDVDVTAMEMTKWFDTNYHYIVAEFSKDTKFKLLSSKIFDEYKEAKELGIETRPVIVGPVTFLLLGKSMDNSNKFDLLDSLLETYEELFAKLAEIGVKDVQIDEPFLATDLSLDAANAYEKAYKKINELQAKPNIHLTTYFESLADNTDLALSLNTTSIHIDLIRAPEQLDKVLNSIKEPQKLSLGLVDGRNVWINNLSNSVAMAKKAIDKLGKERVIVGPSCSLLHTPVDLNNETTLDSEIKSWMAFATQKLNEISTIAKAADGEESDVKDILEQNVQNIQNRSSSSKIHNDKVKERTSKMDQSFINRQSNFAQRKEKQNNHINLPLLPTTTIGSFPQTKEVRKARADFKAGRITPEQYDQFLKDETIKTIKFQEDIGLDVLVHGEFERNDMVEYFGEQLEGFCFTKNGWVQSYGSRCVKPPIIFGDVSRPNPMTVKWSKFAQEQSKQIMKGMLTGPITILQWSFVRDDQPRKDTALQIAFAIRDEVCDLEAADIKIIQIDEAALREGLPIRKAKWDEYLKWAVEAFRVSASGVKDETQIHTHMCYSEFNDIIAAIADMDADVISIETSRSQMELLNAFVNFKYPNEIGPGVYDIHSPRVPMQEEMENLLKKALKVLKPEQIWVNPDCGLKTRGWEETRNALQKMVDATKAIRSQI